MPTTLLDVTDLVEFLQRRESPSGVQRVIAETAPLLIARYGNDLAPVILDRPTGHFVALDPSEIQALLVGPGSRDAMADAASAVIARARTASAVEIVPGAVAVFLGAVWIADALMIAARDLHAHGAKLVFLLYDLTPVLETGHTAAVNRLFERYLALVLECGAAVPAISQSSRDDLATYAQQLDLPLPPGTATGLPCGITPGQFDTSENPWPRPYALFVGTIEARKQHEVALAAWRALIERHGAANVPDLVCIGRLGWHSDAFLREIVATEGLGGKVSLLTNSVPDAELAGFYAHADFTVYPSRYEGWGLPVSESLAFGKVAITARNSSLAEAGGDLATYTTTGDVDDLVAAIERDGLDVTRRSETERRIRAEFRDLTWQHVADAIAADIEQARASKESKPVFPQIELGREYVIAPMQAAPDAGHGDKVMDFLMREGLTPLLRQPRREDDYRTVDAALIGEFGSPQTWGNEVRPGRRVQLRVERPVDGPLVVLFSTRAQPGIVRVSGTGPGGPTNVELHLGAVLTLPLGDGKAGEPAQVDFHVTDAHDSIEGFMGVRSFVVLRADDLQAQLIAANAATNALRAELDFIQGTRSWKITAPLRKMKGRGAS